MHNYQFSFYFSWQITMFSLFSPNFWLYFINFFGTLHFLPEKSFFSIKRVDYTRQWNLFILKYKYLSKTSFLTFNNEKKSFFILQSHNNPIFFFKPFIIGVMVRSITWFGAVWLHFMSNFGWFSLVLGNSTAWFSIQNLHTP